MPVDNRGRTWLLLFLSTFSWLFLLLLCDITLCIYIYILSSTDRLFRSTELFSVAKHVGRSKPGSKPIQLYVRLSLRPLGQQTYHVWLREFLKVLCSNSSSRLFTFFNTLSATRVLNSFEELCIMRAAAENSFIRVLNPYGEAYIYIYIYINCYLYLASMCLCLKHFFSFK